MVEKVELASLYNDLAETMQQESKEFKSIMKEVKKAAKQGKFSVNVKIDEDSHDSICYPYTRIKTDLVRELEDAGFNLKIHSKKIKFFGGWDCYITISWRKN